MDVSAIFRATETDLRDMGLQEKGHIICLKTYSMKESGNNREKDELCRKIRETAVERCGKFTPKRYKCTEAKSLKAQELRNNGRSHKTIYLEWLHAIKAKGRYKSVRLANDGGVRKVSLPGNMEKVIDTGKQIFFLNSQNSFGTLTSISAKLGNFQGEPITECAISIQNYIKKHYLSKTRLYLLTSVKSSQEIIKGILDECGSDSEFEFLPSSKPLSTNDTILNIGESPLLGAPVERQTLKEEIKNSYLELQRKDALKKRARMNKKSHTKRTNKMQRQFPEHGNREFLQNRVFWRKVI